MQNSNSKKEHIRTLSFFSGAGGLDIGFHSAGFDIVLTSDYEKVCCQSIEKNKPTYTGFDTKVLCSDIREIEPEDLPDDIDFIIGGPPCQAYSASGRRAGGAAGKLDERGNLFLAYGKIIAAKQPKGFVFENVRGILGSNKGEDWKEIVEYFWNLGYSLGYRIIDACDFGIAQHRERVILVGHQLEHEFLFPRPLFGPDSIDKRPHISASAAFEDLKCNERLDDLVFSGGKYSHLLKEVPPGGNYLYFTDKRGYPNPIFAYRSRFSDFLYKADPHKPTKTLIASPGKYTGPLHWDNRYLSISEYKRLQGFPDDYQLTGNRTEQIRQIGNSVSPKLAYYVAQAVANQIFQMKLDNDVNLVDRSFQFSFDKRKGKQAQQTKKKHNAIRIMQIEEKRKKFTLKSYTAEISPHSFNNGYHNVQVETSNNIVKMKVMGDDCDNELVTMSLGIGINKDINLFNSEPYELEINVELFGSNDHCIQTMWNAIDDWVIRSSSYHSLFEIYGHFTEPHPDFVVLKFNTDSDSPICRFAKFSSQFINCSKFVPKSHLLELFSDTFGINEFVPLMNYLRKFRFDIRSKETNVAIDDGSYMIAYPFTLPTRKQMNFRAKHAEINA